MYTCLHLWTWCCQGGLYGHYHFLSPAVHNEQLFKDDTHVFYEFDRSRRPRSSSFPSSKIFRLSWGPSQQNGEEDSLNPSGGRQRSSSSSIISSPRSSRSSLTSVLDECFDTITQLGPEVLIYATLLKE